MSQLNGRSVAVTLDKERRLRYTFNALCELQTATGRTLDDALASGSVGFLEVRGIIWAGLIQEDPTLTLIQAGEAIQTYLENGGSFANLVVRMHEALSVSGLIGTPAKESDGPLASRTSSEAPSPQPTAPSASSLGSSSS